MSTRSELYWLRKEEIELDIRNKCLDIKEMQKVTGREHPHYKDWLPDGKRMQEAMEKYRNIEF